MQRTTTGQYVESENFGLNSSTAKGKWKNGPAPNQEATAIGACWERENWVSPTECYWSINNIPG